MLSKLTVKPLLWATGILALLLAGSSWLNVQQYKAIGAARAECEVTRLEDSNKRSDVTRSLEVEALRSKVAALEAELEALRELSKAVAIRHAQNEALLDDYRKQLDAARKADPSLDEPADTSRLRALEDAYRVRASRDRNDSVQANP